VSVITDPGFPADPAVVAALRMASERLSYAGYLVEESCAPSLERAGELYYQIMSIWGRVQEEQPAVEGIAPGEFARFWAGFAEPWTAASGKHGFDPMMERAAIARAWHSFMATAPLVLAPVCATPAFEVGADLEPQWQADWPAAIRVTVAVNLLGLPSVAVPVGLADGLPQGVQIIGPRFREDLCLDAAEAVEARLTPVDLSPGPRLEALPRVRLFPACTE
jgi:amidase